MEKLLRSRFGSLFTIDLDKHVVRVRLVEPRELDVVDLFAGFKQNNLGVLSITLALDASVEGEQIVASATRQRWPLAEAQAKAPAARRTVTFTGFEEATTLRASAE